MRAIDVDKELIIKIKKGIYYLPPYEMVWIAGLVPKFRAFSLNYFSKSSLYSSFFSIDWYFTH